MADTKMKLIIMSDHAELKKCNNQMQQEEKARNGKPIVKRRKSRKTREGCSWFWSMF